MFLRVYISLGHEDFVVLRYDHFKLPPFGMCLQFHTPRLSGAPRKIRMRFREPVGPIPSDVEEAKFLSHIPSLRLCSLWSSVAFPLLP